MRFTDIYIKNLKKKDKRYEVTEGKGLYIRVMPSGAKSWYFKYKFNKTPRRMMLGSYPSVTLADASKLHAEARLKLKQKERIDPGKEKIDEKLKRKLEPRFEDILKEFWEIELIKKKSGGQSKYLLEKNVIPKWRRKKVKEITRRDIVDLLDGIKDRAPIVGNRVHGVLTRLFNFAAERGIINDSPCTRIRKIEEKGRSRVLTDAEIKMLWNALDLENKAVDIYNVSKLALKLILLTGQRPGEVTGMTLTEIDGDYWNIPAERMKSGEPHRVPLLGMAKDIIEQARPYSVNSQYVFTSPRSPLYGFKKPWKAKPKDADSSMTPHALSRAINRHFKDIGIEERFTPHDLRRTLRTKLAELGIDDVIAERVMGHKLQGVLGIYNRHSYDSEKRQALFLWEKHLSKIICGETETTSNVIPFEVRHG